MKKLLNIFILPIIAFTQLSFEIPSGWVIGGSQSMSYEMGIEKGSGHDGKNAATIKSIEKKIEGNGTLMQQVRPGGFLGKRIRMTGYVKSENVKKKAGLWLRVNQADSKEPLSFDNMSDRQIRGTTAWIKYEIVLDVPNHATQISYGGLLVGTGQIWFDTISFEIVDNSVPTTGSINGKELKILDEPVNLDFEK